MDKHVDQPPQHCCRAINPQVGSLAEEIYQVVVVPVGDDDPLQLADNAI